MSNFKQKNRLSHTVVSMFYSKIIQTFSAIAVISTTCLFGVQNTNAAVYYNELNLTPYSTNQADLPRILHHSYNETLTFVQTGGGNNARNAGIPTTPLSTRDVLVVTISSASFNNTNIHVYVNPSDLYIMGFSTDTNNSRIYYFNDTFSNNDNPSLTTYQSLIYANLGDLRNHGIVNATNNIEPINLGSSNYGTLDSDLSIRTSTNFTIPEIQLILTQLTFGDPTGASRNRALVVLTQYISEAARFLPIRSVMSDAALNSANANFTNYLPVTLVRGESRGDWSAISRLTFHPTNTSTGAISPFQLGDSTLYTIYGVQSYGLGVLLGSQQNR